MNKYLPNGTLGIALAGLLAAFMAGMAANVSSFNTVFTYDIWQTYVVKDRPDRYYLRVGRIVTVVGILIGIGTAFIASGYSNIMNYIQLLFSFFNAPLFATFIIAMFWKRSTPWAGFSGLAAGTAGAAVMHFAGYHIAYFYPAACSTDPREDQRADGQLLRRDHGVRRRPRGHRHRHPGDQAEAGRRAGRLVWGVPDPNAPDPASVPKPAGGHRPSSSAACALGIVLVLSIIFA